jgi:predicted small secreted protein
LEKIANRDYPLLFLNWTSGLTISQTSPFLLVQDTNLKPSKMLNEVKDTKAMETKVERYEFTSDAEAGFVKPVQETAAMGTVTITDLNEIFLVPAPSADPRGSWFAAES